MKKIFLTIIILCCFVYAYTADFPIFLNSRVEQIQVLKAIKNNQNIKALNNTITGIILPHHLLAADLIAQALALSQKQKPKLIIILAPDHFKRSKTAFAVPTDRDFLTFLGKVKVDKVVRKQLLLLPEVSESNLFSQEHSIRAILPFIAYYFPNSKILPIVIHPKSSKIELENLLIFLQSYLKNTIIIQSTDFSHYLSEEEAKKYDQHTLDVLYSQNSELALNLNSQTNVDSPKAMFLQMNLQKNLNSKIIFIKNRNSAEYVKKGEKKPQKTTSYILAIYAL